MYVYMYMYNVIVASMKECVTDCSWIGLSSLQGVDAWPLKAMEWKVTRLPYEILLEKSGREEGQGNKFPLFSVHVAYSTAGGYTTQEV